MLSASKTKLKATTSKSENLGTAPVGEHFLGIYQIEAELLAYVKCFIEYCLQVVRIGIRSYLLSQT